MSLLKSSFWFGYLLVFLVTGSRALGLEIDPGSSELGNHPNLVASNALPTLVAADIKVKAAQAGMIEEIRNQQVWIISADKTQKKKAIAGMELKVGDIVKTGKDAMAQIKLTSGITFRIGSNATTIIQPDRTMRITAGEALIWRKTGQNVNTRVYGKRAVASIRGTTIHVKVEDDCVFSVWEGEISLKLEKALDEEVILTTGEQVRVAVNVEVMRKFTSDVETIAADRFRQTLAASPLLNDFSEPIDTQADLDRVLEQLNS
jgi:hypothetical protein